jgi:flagellar biosynthetic protein FlhB
LSGDNRTEHATPRRHNKARERGQIARSRELPSALVVLAMTLLLGWKAPAWAGQWRGLFRQFMNAGIKGDISSGTTIATKVGWTMFDWMGPILALIWLLAVMGMIAQGGMVFAGEALQPDWNRLNPAHNMRQLISGSGLSRLLKSLLPFGLVLYLGFTVFLRDWEQMVHASGMETKTLLVWIVNRLFEFSWKAGLALLTWSGLDYAVQHMQMERGLRMTKQEVREEFKETEGHPGIKARIRRIQRDLRRRRMMKDVPTATVVITNPNEYAVALRYHPATMAAPLVVAKGRNLLAQRIKQLARWSEVPIMENPPLARALYKAAEVGQNIPANLYTAVAEILAFIYRMQGGWQGGPPTAARNQQNSDT